MNITTGSAVAALAFVFLCRVDAAPSEEQLAKEAKIARSEAEHIALSKVPDGRVSSGELEREHGMLIWSFDIAKAGTRNINEVQVDAKTGKVVSVKIETPKDQAEEAAADKNKK
jgi:Predicted membrane protein